MDIHDLGMIIESFKLNEDERFKVDREIYLSKLQK